LKDVEEFGDQFSALSPQALLIEVDQKVFLILEYLKLD
jgi:hypothetical protein